MKKNISVFLAIIVLSVIFYPCTTIKAIRLSDTIEEPSNLSNYKTENLFVVKALWHVHTKFSDGWKSVPNIIKNAKKEEYRVIFFSDHTDNIGDHDLYQEYYNTLKKYNEEGAFIILVGRELTVGGLKAKGFCHINAISLTNIPLMNSWAFKRSELPKLLAELDKEGAIYVFNHPYECPKWMGEATRFHGIELFNHFKYEDYDKLVSAYKAMVRKSWKGFVVGGIDYHIYGQNLIRGEVSTFIFTNKIGTWEILEAIQDGRTAAALNIKSFWTNLYPSRMPHKIEGDSFMLKGSIGFEPSHTRSKQDKNQYLSVFYYDTKGNHSEDKVAFEKIKADSFADTYSFSTNIIKSGCYVLELADNPGKKLVTSPICFNFTENTSLKQNPSNAPPSSHPDSKGFWGKPGKAFKIISASANYNSLIFENEHEDYSNSHFDAFIICNYDSSYFFNEIQGRKEVFGCRYPIFALALSERKTNSTMNLIYMSERSHCSSGESEKCSTTLKESFLIGIDNHEHIAVANGNMSVFLLTSDKNVKKGDVFEFCEPGSEKIANNAIDCKTYVSGIVEEFSNNPFPHFKIRTQFPLTYYGQTRFFWLKK